MKKRRQQSAADQSTQGAGGISGAVALRITLRILPITGEAIGSLFYTGGDAARNKGHRIEFGSKCQLELLLGREGRCVPNVAAVKIGNDGNMYKSVSDKNGVCKWKRA